MGRGVQAGTQRICIRIKGEWASMVNETDLIKKVQLNGKIVELPEQVTTVWDLLAFYQLEDRIVVVELNKEIAVKENYRITPVVAGDVIEIIHFVGGG